MPKAAKKTTPVVKATRSTKAVKAPAPAPVPENKDNRYLRAAKQLIIIGGNPSDIDLIELSVRAQMSPATAGHCLSAYIGVCQALREAGMLPQRKAPAKPPVAPRKPQTRGAATPRDKDADKPAQSAETQPQPIPEAEPAPVPVDADAP